MDEPRNSIFTGDLVYSTAITIAASNLYSVLPRSTNTSSHLLWYMLISWYWYRSQLCFNPLLDHHTNLLDQIRSANEICCKWYIKCETTETRKTTQHKSQGSDFQRIWYIITRKWEPTTFSSFKIIIADNPELICTLMYATYMHNEGPHRLYGMMYVSDP